MMKGTLGSLLLNTTSFVVADLNVDGDRGNVRLYQSKQDILARRVGVYVKLARQKRYLLLSLNEDTYIYNLRSILEDRLHTEFVEKYYI